MEQEDYEEMGSHAQITSLANKAANEAAQYYLEEKEKGIVDIQLEVDSIKEDIYHLLRQDRLVIDNDTKKIEWKPINDIDRTLTDYGVERLMQVIHFYINKNTLLTNFDEKQIRDIMRSFMHEINDLVLLKYEYLFGKEDRKAKIREYGMLIAQLEVQVYATLNRAFRGEERGSIRRHTQISELIGGRSPMPQQKGGLFSWGSK